MQIEKTVDACADECCAPPPLVLPSKESVDRVALVQNAFRLEWLTIASVTVETVVAITSGGAVAICVGIEFGAISSVTRLPDHAARSML